MRVYLRRGAGVRVPGGLNQMQTPWQQMPGQIETFDVSPDDALRQVVGPNAPATKTSCQLIRGQAARRTHTLRRIAAGLPVNRQPIVKRGPHTALELPRQPLQMGFCSAHIITVVAVLPQHISKQNGVRRVAL